MQLAAQRVKMTTHGDQKPIQNWAERPRTSIKSRKGWERLPVYRLHTACRGCRRRRESSSCRFRRRPGRPAHTTTCETESSCHQSGADRRPCRYQRAGILTQFRSWPRRPATHAAHRNHAHRQLCNGGRCALTETRTSPASTPAHLGADRCCRQAQPHRQSADPQHRDQRLPAAGNYDSRKGSALEYKGSQVSICSFRIRPQNWAAVLQEPPCAAQGCAGTHRFKPCSILRLAAWPSCSSTVLLDSDALIL